MPTDFQQQIAILGKTSVISQEPDIRYSALFGKPKAGAMAPL
jgi:hypothetical protein